MIKLIREFIEYRKALRAFEIIELTENEKTKLSLIEKDTIKRICSLCLNELTREMLNDDVSAEYVRWYRQATISFNSYFRNYNNK